MESVDMAWLWDWFNMHYRVDGLGLDHTWAGRGAQFQFASGLNFELYGFYLT